MTPRPQEGIPTSETLNPLSQEVHISATAYFLSDAYQPGDRKGARLAKKHRSLQQYFTNSNNIEALLEAALAPFGDTIPRHFVVVEVYSLKINSSF